MATDCRHRIHLASATKYLCNRVVSSANSIWLYIWCRLLQIRINIRRVLTGARNSSCNPWLPLTRY